MKHDWGSNPSTSILCNILGTSCFVPSWNTTWAPTSAPAAYAAYASCFALSWNTTGVPSPFTGNLHQHKDSTLFLKIASPTQSPLTFPQVATSCPQPLHHFSSGAPPLVRPCNPADYAKLSRKTPRPPLVESVYWSRTQRKASFKPALEPFLPF